MNLSPCSYPVFTKQGMIIIVLLFSCWSLFLTLKEISKIKIHCYPARMHLSVAMGNKTVYLMACFATTGNQCRLYPVWSHVLWLREAEKLAEGYALQLPERINLLFILFPSSISSKRAYTHYCLYCSTFYHNTELSQKVLLPHFYFPIMLFLKEGSGWEQWMNNINSFAL